MRKQTRHCTSKWKADVSQFTVPLAGHLTSFLVFAIGWIMYFLPISAPSFLLQLCGPCISFCFAWLLHACLGEPCTPASGFLRLLAVLLTRKPSVHKLCTPRELSFPHRNCPVHKLGTTVYSFAWPLVLHWPHQHDFVYPCAA